MDIFSQFYQDNKSNFDFLSLFQGSFQLCIERGTGYLNNFLFLINKVTIGNKKDSAILIVIIIRHITKTNKKVEETKD